MFDCVTSEQWSLTWSYGPGTPFPYLSLYKKIAQVACRYCIASRRWWILTSSYHSFYDGLCTTVPRNDASRQAVLATSLYCCQEHIYLPRAPCCDVTDALRCTHTPVQSNNPLVDTPGRLPPPPRKKCENWQYPYSWPCPIREVIIGAAIPPCTHSPHPGHWWTPV